MTDRVAARSRTVVLPETLGRFLRNPTGRLGGLLLVGSLLLAVFAGFFAPYSPLEMGTGPALAPPDQAHWMGTDEFGRDLFSRVLYGMRMSFLVSMLAVVIGGIPGIISGLLTGYFDGFFSKVVLRVWDGMLAFPPLLLAIMFAAVLGPGPFNAAIAIGIISVPEFSRIVRASVLAEKEKDYVLASRSMGVSTARIVTADIFPNVISPIVVQATVAMGAAVALEAALSFIGLGIQPPDPSLGSMLSLSRKFMYQAWWYALFPGAAITLLLVSLNWFSEALVEALDPRSERR